MKISNNGLFIIMASLVALYSLIAHNKLFIEYPDADADKLMHQMCLHYGFHPADFTLTDDSPETDYNLFSPSSYTYRYRNKDLNTQLEIVIYDNNNSYTKAINLRTGATLYCPQ